MFASSETCMNMCIEQGYLVLHLGSMTQHFLVITLVEYMVSRYAISWHSVHIACTSLAHRLHMHSLKVSRLIGNQHEYLLLNSGSRAL
jgi:hypothetical protein